MSSAMPPGQLSRDEIRDVDGGKEKTLTLATLSSQLTAVEEVVERNMVFFSCKRKTQLYLLLVACPVRLMTETRKNISREKLKTS